LEYFLQDRDDSLTPIIAGLFTILFTRLQGRIRSARMALDGIVLYTPLVGARLSEVWEALIGVGLFPAAHRPERVDRINLGWGGYVDEDGKKIDSCLKRGSEAQTC
jgi:hypothetical protein